MNTFNLKIIISFLCFIAMNLNAEFSTGKLTINSSTIKIIKDQMRTKKRAPANIPHADLVFSVAMGKVLGVVKQRLQCKGFLYVGKTVKKIG